MKLKGQSIQFVVLFFLLVVVGGIAIYDFTVSQNKVSRQKQDFKILSHPFEQYDSFQLLKGSSELLIMRGPDGWKIEKPVADYADNDVVEDYLKGISEESVIEVVKEQADLNWKTYGLDAPAAVFVFKTSSGKEDRWEISGIRNFEDHIYARRNQENRLLLVNSVWQTRAERTELDYRERRIFRHKIGSVDLFKVNSKVNSKGNSKDKKILTLQRGAEGKWAFVEASGLKLDQNLIREMLRNFSEAKGSDFVSKIPAKTKALFELELQRDGQTWKAAVVQAPDFGIYAQISDPKMIMKIEPGALDEFIEFNAENYIEQEPLPKTLPKEGP